MRTQRSPRGRRRAARATYFLQHPAGLGALVREALRSDFPDIDTAYCDDSAVLVGSAASSAQVAALPYINTAFLVLTTTPRQELSAAVTPLLRALRDQELLASAPRGGTFRLMVSLDGRLTALREDLRIRLETAITRQTRSRTRRRGSSREYWIIGRRDLGVLVFCLKLPRSKALIRPAGALSNELAHLLVSASLPHSSDVFLDPFAGSGAIVAARAKWPARRLIYSDDAADRLESTLPRAECERHRVEILHDDALTLRHLADGSVDVVATDPPWGEHQVLNRPYDAFVTDLARSLGRVLHRDHGRVVLLTSRRECQRFEDAFATERLPSQRREDILVNGHPASVLVCTRFQRIR